MHVQSLPPVDPVTYSVRQSRDGAGRGALRCACALLGKTWEQGFLKYFRHSECFVPHRCRYHWNAATATL